MYNMGGISKLWWMDADDYEGLTTDGGETLPRLLGDLVNTLTEISFSQNGGSYSCSEMSDDNGILNQIKINLLIPKVSLQNEASSLGVKSWMNGKKIVLLIRDNNDQYIVIGGTGAYFEALLASNTGTQAADMNSVKLNISANLVDEPVFVKSIYVTIGAFWASEDGDSLKLLSSDFIQGSYSSLLIRWILIGNRSSFNYYIWLYANWDGRDGFLVDGFEEQEICYPNKVIIATFSDITLDASGNYMLKMIEV